MKTLSAKLAIVLAVLYELLQVLLIYLRPDLPVYSTTISEWAIGRFGWLMQTAFELSALAYLCLALALKEPKTGRFILLICFLGTVGVGLFVTNPYPPDMRITTTLIHTICGTSAMILLPVAAGFICFRKGNKGLGKWIGLLPILALIGFIVHLNLYIIPLGKNAVGPNVPIGYPSRILFFCYHIWLVIVADIQIKRNQQVNH
ncbi:MAG TPA: DUF998 domain-containing protein [Mucilaginibacter sp.]